MVHIYADIDHTLW